MNYSAMADMAQTKIETFGALVTLYRNNVPYTTYAAFVQNDVIGIDVSKATENGTVLVAMFAPTVAPKILDSLLRFGTTWFIRKISTSNVAGTVLYYEVTFTR